MTRHLFTLAALPLAIARVAVEIARDARTTPQRLDVWPTDCRPARMTVYSTPACAARRRRAAA